jgi:hypothetical protein
MSRSPARRLAVLLVLVLLLAPGVGRARSLAPAKPVTAEHALELAFVPWIHDLVSFLWDSLTGNGAPGASGTTTDLGPDMDPDGATGELGPDMDPNG